MVTRILREAGGQVIHRAFPHGGSKAGRPDSAVWPDLRTESIDAAVVTSRDLRSTVRSQLACCHVDTEERALANIRRAYRDIFAQLTVPFWPVTYESLWRPEAVADLCGWLGLDFTRVQTSVQDANAKWYGGPEFTDRSGLSPRLDALLP